MLWLGGMFVQSERFVKAHGGRVDDISIYGQESNPTTWRLAAMNLAIRGFAADWERTWRRLRVINSRCEVRLHHGKPPFNISDWGGENMKAMFVGNLDAHQLEC